VNRIQRALLSGASALAVCAALSSSVFAQTSTAQNTPANSAPAASPSSGVETVVVTGIRGSLRDSLKMKQNSDLVTENISAKDIGQLPDVTIAEELNTLPGVNATRDRGNDSQVNVRGLGPRLVLGLVNGEEIASSEPDQDIRWEIFPSEIVSGVTVFKTQSANLISGGIAGIVDIHTLAPLDYTGPSFTLRAGPTYNDEANSLPDYSPWGIRASGAWVDKITNNFAIAIGASFQREKSGYSSFQGWGYNEIGQAGDNPPFLGPSGCADTVPYSCNAPGTETNVPWGAQTELTEIQQDRTSVIANMQWRPNSNFEFKFNNIYSHYNITENQQQAWYGNSNGWGEWGGVPGSWPYNEPGSSYTTVQGPNGPDVVAANFANYYSSVTNVIAHYNEDHSLLLSGLNGKWTNGDWIGSADLSYSEADRLNRWQSIETEVFPPDMSFNTAANVTPTVTTPGYDPGDPTNQPLQTYQPGESAGPEHTTDHIGAAQMDFTRTFDSSFFSAVDFGARLSERTKEHTDYQWNYNAPGGTSLPAADLTEITAQGFTVPSMIYGNFEQLFPIAYGTAQADEAPPPGSLQLSQSWKVHESDFEAYMKTEFSQDIGSIPMSGDLGVRLVTVDSQSSGYEQISGGAFTPVTLSHAYTDVLPSLNLNFHLADDQILRFGAAQAISRPPLDELRTGYSLSPTPPATGSGGNPLLNPYKDEQVDLSYEWYWHEESLLAIAPFYKHLDTFIGYATNSQTIQGVDYAMTAPFNGKGGDITGVELTGQSRFYFLPSFLKDFGVYSNYSYVDSDVHEFTPTVHPFDATGFAKNTAEVDLWYSKDAFEARLAFKYHSPFTVIYGWNSQELVGLASEKTLDFSTTYQWTDNIGLRFEAHNLTNQPERMYWNNDPNELARYDLYGRSYLIDITYHD
jgi:iron complex outermembrane recepter protein